MEFLVLILFIISIAALVRTSRLISESGERENQISRLRERVYELEKGLENFGKSSTRQAQLVPPPEPTSAETPARVEKQPKRPIIVPSQPPSPREIAAAPVAPPVAPATVAGESSRRAPETPTGPTQAGTAVRISWSGLEERLGANWLNKIGTAALVIGAAFLLNYSMLYLGKTGKVALIYGLSGALLGLGVMGERRDRYRIAARAVLGGGWALAYATTYAVHNVEAVKLVQSPAVAFGLLFLTAAAMVAHSLRYNSQIVAGFAYLLGFASVAVSRVTMETLVASAVLATSLVVVSWRRRWYRMEPLAILATYAIHWLWLRQVFEALGGHVPFPQFPFSVALLTGYWLIFTVSHFLREDRESKQRHMLTLAFLLNAGCYLAMMRYQSLYPELRFGFLLGAGATYLAISILSTRLGRRLGFVLFSTLGAALLFTAIPYRFSGAPLELLWVAEAEALLFIGWRLADAHLRKLGWGAAGVLAIYVVFHDLSPRLTDTGGPDTRLAWLLLALAAAYYANSRLTYPLLGTGATETDESAAKIASPVGTAFLLAAVWVALPFLWVAPVWTLLALVLREVGHRAHDQVLRACGHGTALLALCRLLLINIQDTSDFRGLSLRLLTVGLALALFYLSARRIRTQAVEEELFKVPELLARHGGLPAAYTWTGTVLAALLIWNEVTNAAIGLAWALLSLALMEVGRARPDRPLLVQSYTLLTLSFARIFIADLNTTAMVGGISARLVTVVLLAAIYYYAAFTAPEGFSRMRTALFWFAMASLAALLRFELVPEWVAVGWAGFTVILYLAGRRLSLPALRHQAYLLTLLVGARCAFDNFYQVQDWSFTNIRTVTVVAASAFLYSLLGFALVERAKLVPGEPNQPGAAPEPTARFQKAANWLDLQPHQLFFFVPTILLTVLVSLEVPRGYLTAAWGLEGLLVFVVVLKIGERTFRWFSLALLLVCVARVVAVDVWALDPLGRIISFMGLGAALLAVSFLYARYREALGKYL